MHAKTWVNCKTIIVSESLTKNMLRIPFIWLSRTDKTNLQRKKFRRVVASADGD